MGDPIDVGHIRVDDTVRVVNPVGETKFTVREITDMGTGLLLVWDGIKAYGGRPGDGPEAYNHFFLVDRPSVPIESRGLAELIVRGKDETGERLRVQDPLRELVPKFLGLKETKKGGRRRRKTRKSRP